MLYYIYYLITVSAGSMAVCVITLNAAYYLITLLLLVVSWLCVYLSTCLLPYYLITVSAGSMAMCISL